MFATDCSKWGLSFPKLSSCRKSMYVENLLLEIEPITCLFLSTILKHYTL